MNNWTSQPTVTGYYWLRNYLLKQNAANGFKPDAKPTVVHFIAADKHLYPTAEFCFVGSPWLCSPDDMASGEWCGPLEPPT